MQALTWDHLRRALTVPFSMAENEVPTGTKSNFGTNLSVTYADGLKVWPQFFWDLNSHLSGDVTTRLAQCWEQSSKSSETNLSETEKAQVENVLQKDDETLDEDIREIFQHSWDEFHAVELRLLSLCCAWRRMCHEKLRFDREGHQPMDGRRISRTECRLFWELIPSRAQCGVSLSKRDSMSDQDVYSQIWQTPATTCRVEKLKEGRYWVRTQKYNHVALDGIASFGDVGYHDPRHRLVGSSVWGPDIFGDH